MYFDSKTINLAITFVTTANIKSSNHFVLVSPSSGQFSQAAAIIAEHNIRCYFAFCTTTRVNACLGSGCMVWQLIPRVSRDEGQSWGAGGGGLPATIIENGAPGTQPNKLNLCQLTPSPPSRAMGFYLLYFNLEIIIVQSKIKDTYLS